MSLVIWQKATNQILECKRDCKGQKRIYPCSVLFRYVRKAFAKVGKRMEETL
jgi:hypothetical protein